MKQKQILAIVPAYNESGNISRAVQELLELSEPPDVLVVDDGSFDNTADAAEQAGARVVSLPFNLGIGGAVQTGFLYAIKHNYDIAVQVDGDAQHDAKYLKELIKPVLDDESDMTIGSRFTGPYTGYQSSFIRRIGINFFARLLSFILRCEITDPTSGFRAYNKKSIRIFAEDYPHDYPEPEAIVVAKKCGLRILEVPVKMRKRSAGTSSIRYFYTLYYMIKVTFAILINMIKSKKVV